MSRAVDVVVIGGGPAGHAAALAAAGRGASVVLVEAEAVGGSCVHHTCIPSGIMLSAAGPFLEAQELGVMGVFDVGHDLRLGRAAARRGSLVARLAGGVKAALDHAGVEVVDGNARLVGPGQIEVRLVSGGTEQLDAGAVVVAAGTRWEAPKVDGAGEARVVTLDAVIGLETAPASAVVLGGGPARTAFSVESAFLLAVAGTSVTFVTADGLVVPALDAEVDAVARSALEGVGATVLDAGDRAAVHQALAAAEVVVAPDTRRPHTDGLGLEAAGVKVDEDGAIVVDAQMRTSVPSVLAAGDVTGGPMVTQAAAHGGRVAGTNASSGDMVARLGAVPHVLHTVPEIGWVGMSAAEATAAGYEVAVGMVDLSWSARAVTLGGREGVLELVAEPELGQVLGVAVVGPEAAEVVAVAALAIQSELTVDDLASTVQWHPSAAENLADAARQLAR